MEPSPLADAGQFPTQDMISAIIGKSGAQWRALFDYIHARHADFAEEWRYYRDTKCWLLKVTCRKKTVFWLSVIPGAFRTTFYFTDKAREALLSSGLSEELKDQFRNGKPAAKIKGIMVVYAHTKDVEDAKILIGIKLQMK